MINLTEFEDAIISLKNFINEQEKLHDVLKVISPSGTGVCEFGNQFIDDYISLLEKSINDDNNMVSWFVFENDFGDKKYKIHINNIDYKITNTKELFDVCTILNNQK